MKKDIQLNNYKTLLEWMTAVRRDFHMYPEIGTFEFRTHEKICSYLDEMGIKHKTLYKTGVVADIEGENKNFTIAFRGDIDALPITDVKNKEYASKNVGFCHACGHDAHTTIVLGLARYFWERNEKPPVNIRLIFQPAEETTGGALPMIEEGALDGVDMIFGLHVDEYLKTGEIGIKYDAMNASSDEIEIEIQGESCHGAYPHNGFDAMVITAQVISALQSVVSRNTDPRDAVVLTLGTIHGGTQSNIVANSIKMTGTIRTLDPVVRKKTHERIVQIVENVAAGMGGKGIANIIPSYAALINHDEAVDIVKLSSAELLGDSALHMIKKPSMGVEDFSYFVEKVKGAFFNLGVRNEEKGISAQAHNGLFDIDEDALVIGVLMQLENMKNVIKKYC